MTMYQRDSWTDDEGVVDLFEHEGVAAVHLLRRQCSFLMTMQTVAMVSW